MSRAAEYTMKHTPREPRNAKKARKCRENRKNSVARLGLENYNAWQQNRSALRQWLVKQIAERAIQIFQSRRNES
jgi:hypothetical protein